MPNKPRLSIIDQRFMDCASNGDIAATQRALDNGANINVVNAGKSNALMSVVRNRDYKMADFLLKHGIETEVFDNSSQTPLFAATKAADYEMVSLLLEGGADPNWPPRRYDDQLSFDEERMYRGFVSLHQASVDGNMDIAKLLLDHGADLNMQCRTVGGPLSFAVVNHHHDLAATYLALGASPDCDRSEEGIKGEQESTQQSILFSLYDPRKIPVLRMCLDAGADMDKRNDKNETIIESLEQKKSGRELVTEVYDHYCKLPALTDERLQNLTKAELFAQNDDGFCLMDSPSTWKRFDEVQQKLSAAGETLTPQDWQATNSQGMSWLERAAECFAVKPALESYVAGGGSLASALLEKDGKPSATLATALRLQQTEQVFSVQLWRNSDAKGSTLRQAYSHVPPENKGDVRHYHMLQADLERSSAQGLGR